MKIQDPGGKNLPINQRDMNDEVLRAWNNGLYEIKKISTSSPNWTESVAGIPVLSVYGANGRLYISDPTTTNGWWYVDLSEL